MEPYKTAEILRKENKEIKDLVLAVRKYIFYHAKTIPLKNRYEPKNIIESRLTTADEAFAKGMLTCGTISTITAEMLKHVGLRVRFIHGESKESVDHAWISVLDTQTNAWVEYDLTRPNVDVPITHIKKLEAETWDKIEKQIYSDHKTMVARRKKRSL